ncbi:phage recombination protein Bet [Paraburkholderia bannensis]|uniref:Phage recombination protein Bet n=1 Tax=Paraburkholderia bannensis TaxID=765414 RepID=A0A7W9TYT5_9BURK|nr:MULTISPECIES: phage recombination protein Bet [Paraburkholderia]MBB3257672.1 phage recombination protein Bet [Paraburkholderia sp. WP4_3_2]MBB6102685.1 phage recombination protein Bet [Paraburkholderia bannensis]
MSTAVTTGRQSLVSKFADKYSIEPSKLMDTLKSTCFKQQGDREVSNEQMAALLIVADQYGLNPFTKEIYAFPDKGGIVPVIGVDGWARIVNEHPQCNGFEFAYADDKVEFSGKQVPEWMEVRIYRKDRERPVVVREYFDEVVRRSMQPWQSHPNRMLRHKTFVQGARLAFGFAGVFDEDEAQRIVERDMGRAEEVPQPQSRSAKQAAPRTTPAIEQADADGVIEQPEQRHAEPVQRSEKPAQQQERQAAPRTRAQRADQEKFEDAPATPVSDSVMRILQTKMEQNGINEADIRKKFGFDLDGVTTANYNAVVEFVEDPMAA